MTQAIDWEAQIEEIRSKATAAARHSERTVSGVAQSLSEISAQARAINKLDKGHQEIIDRLGSLELALKERPVSLDATVSQRANGFPTAVIGGLIGILFGAVLSGVFFWN